MSQGETRSERKDAAARAALVPLREGERPRAVTVAAAISLVLAIGEVVAFAAGLEVQGEQPAETGVVIFVVLMLVMAWGMWRARYWAVLGMQALLGLSIVTASLALITAEDARGFAVALAIIVPSAVLFWFLVKALARIQMPQRHP